MAGASLLTLIDDIATLLDDVAAMSKIAARKTAGVLGDDLALNAEQVTGFGAERELPVIWAVAKGSALNKVVLIAFALLISAVLPQAIVPLLMIGGAYLCFEGAEKLAHKLLHNNSHDIVDAVDNVQKRKPIDEKKRIRGAIRTDFILSAEIIVISLGTVSEASFSRQLLVLIVISVVVVVGVYGLVAGIVKIDDAGLALLRATGESTGARFQRSLGQGLLNFAPILMRLLGIVGTIAMFLVGGSIIAHGIPVLGHLLEEWSHVIAGAAGGFAGSLSLLVMEGLFGVAVGAVLVVVFELVQKARGK